MQGVILSTAKPSQANAAAPPRVAGRSYRVWAAAAIAVLTVARLIWLGATTANLYPDEAQYWFWSLHPALGYYSKPPLVAWVIALTTRAFGDSEFALRMAAPLLHAIAAAFVYGIAARLYNCRTGFWSALAYITLPGVSLSAFLISTDAVLLPCWAAALYAFIRAREPGGERWWIAVGITAGLGLLAKYAMAYWLLSAFGYVLLVREERRHLPRLLGASLIALLLYLPNLWWNWQHDFVSYRHVRDNAEIAGVLLHPGAFLGLFASQFAVFGPLCFVAMIPIPSRALRSAEPRARLLAAFPLPALAMMQGVSLLSRAQPNWAAPTYVSATVLAVAWELGREWRRGLRTAIAINVAGAIALFGVSDALAAVGIAIPARYDPLHRLHGWRVLGQEVAAALAAHPALTLLGDDRELPAALVYYVRTHPLDAAHWNPIPALWDPF